MRTPAIDAIFLFIIINTLFLLFLGDRPFAVPDEGRYAEIPREMLLLGDYVVPHLNFLMYFEKPPLFYWIQAFSLHLFGLNEWAARFPSALIASLGCLVNYIAAYLLFNRKTAILSCIILASSLLYFIMGHINTLDMTLSFFLSLSLFSFIIAEQYPLGKKRYHAMMAMYLFAALATLTKGLVGIVFPTLIIGSYMLLLRRWRLLTSCYPIRGACLFLLVTAPWHILAQLREADFSWFYFMEQHILRYATEYAGREKPLWFLPLVFILGFFPWICFLPSSISHPIRHHWQQHKEKYLFLLLWPSIIFVFFYVSHSQLIPYILPMFAPLAVLVAHYLAQQLEQQTRSFHYAYLTLFILSIIFSLALLIVPYFVELPYPEKALPRFHLAAIIIGLAAVISYYFYRKAKLELSGISYLFGFFAMLITLIISTPFVDNRSIKPMADILNQQLKDEDEVVSYDHYYQDLPFYLKRKVSVVGWKNELSFGIQHAPEQDWMYDKKTLLQRWHSPKRIFLLSHRHHYPHLKQKLSPLYTIAENQRDILLSNKADTP